MYMLMTSHDTSEGLNKHESPSWPGAWKLQIGVSNTKFSPYFLLISCKRGVTSAELAWKQENRRSDKLRYWHLNYWTIIYLVLFQREKSALLANLEAYSCCRCK